MKITLSKFTRLLIAALLVGAASASIWAHSIVTPDASESIATIAVSTAHSIVDIGLDACYSNGMETACPDANTCLSSTADNPRCKDCCDCLHGKDAAVIKACRDACAKHDFGQTSASLVFTVPSVLGPQGDYTPFTASGSQQECKRLCDSSTTLACGDRRFCRDACNKLAN